VAPLAVDGAGHFVKRSTTARVRADGGLCEGLNIPRACHASATEREQNAETTPLRDPILYRYELDLPAIAELWRRGSVVQLVAARPDCAGVA